MFEPGDRVFFAPRHPLHPGDAALPREGRRGVVERARTDLASSPPIQEIIVVFGDVGDAVRFRGDSRDFRPETAVAWHQWKDEVLGRTGVSVDEDDEIEVSVGLFSASDAKATRIMDREPVQYCGAGIACGPGVAAPALPPPGRFLGFCTPCGGFRRHTRDCPVGRPQEMPAAPEPVAAAKVPDRKDELYAIKLTPPAGPPRIANSLTGGGTLDLMAYVENVTRFLRDRARLDFELMRAQDRQPPSVC